MRLTVGPLPPAVYWRRRALVLGILVLVVLVIVYACGGPSVGGTQPSQNLGSATQTPTTPETGTTTTSVPPFTLPVNSQTAVTGPCTDAEILLTAESSDTSLAVGDGATFTLRIKNISMRTCQRNVGSLPQELQLRDAAESVVWSSDDCRGPAYVAVDADRPFTPGMELSFQVADLFFGYRTRYGNGALTCERTTATTLAAGNYTLVARLATLFSQPLRVTIGSVS